MKASRLAPALAALAILTAVAALWFLHDNPSIDNTSYGDDYNCLAPWDTVLNGADNVPGGDPAPDASDIAARCRAAGEAHFERAVALGLVAACCGVGAAVTRRPSGGESADQPGPARAEVT